MSKLRETIKIANKVLNIRVPYKKNQNSKEVLQSILTLDGSLLAFLDQVFWHVDIDALSDDDMRTACSTFRRVKDDESVLYEVDTDYFLSLSEEELGKANSCLKKIHDSLKEIEGIVRIEKDKETEEEKVNYTVNDKEYENFEDSEIYKFMLCRLTADQKLLANPVLRNLIEKECRRLKLPFMGLMPMMATQTMYSHQEKSSEDSGNSGFDAMRQMFEMQVMQNMMSGAMSSGSSSPNYAKMMAQTAMMQQMMHNAMLNR